MKYTILLLLGAVLVTGCDKHEGGTGSYSETTSGTTVEDRKDAVEAQADAAKNEAEAKADVEKARIEAKKDAAQAEAEAKKEAAEAKAEAEKAKVDDLK